MRRAVLLALCLWPLDARAAMLAPGDTCKVETALAITTKAKGKGKLQALKAGTKIKIVALNDHEYEVSTGDKRGFGREDIFDKGCVKLNLPTLVRHALRPTQ
jgi:hypothetical protein